MVQRIKTGMIADGAVTTAKMNDEVENLFSFRNRIINGDMRIWQRGTSFSGSQQFTADRFVVNSSTGTVTRDTDVPSGQGFTYSMKQVSSNQAFCFLQPVELITTGVAGEFSVGSTWTFSFWMKGSGSGSISLGPEFRDTGISAANFVTAATGTTINYTSTWTRFSYTFTITGTPNGTNTGLSCILFQSGQTGSLWATGFQLEAGSNATPFERRPYGTELRLCQRYYQSHGNMFQCGQAYGTGVDGFTVNYSFPVTMRAAPTSTVVGGSDGGSAAQLVVSNINTYKCTFEVRNNGGGGTSKWYTWNQVFSAEI
jgi:hypothetical protein